MAKAQTKASNKYNAKAYDRIALQVKKGQREEIRQFAESKGLSLNGYINKLISEDMNGSQSETQTAGADTLELSAAVPTASEREECENLNEEKNEYSDYDFKCSICNIEAVIDDFGEDGTFEINFCPKCGRRIKQ